MQSNPLVSIIIPTYNRAHLIGETLDSIVAQTYDNWECIIVDDGSTDNSYSVIKSYIEKDKRFQFHERPVNRQKGANACRNHGLKISKGDLVLFLDSDDFLSKSCLEGRVDIFNKHTEINVVVANTSYFINGKFQTNLFNSDTKNHSQNTYLKMFLQYKIPWTIMGAMWEKSVIVNVSFDERLLRLQDLDFSIEVLSTKKINVYRLNEIDTYYRKANKKVNEIDFLEDSKKIMYSLRILFDKIKNNQEGNNQTYFSQFIFFIFFKYFYPNYKNLKKDYSYTEKEFIALCGYNLKEMFFFKLKKYIYVNKINKIDRRFIWQTNRYCDNIIKRNT